MADLGGSHAGGPSPAGDHTASAGTGPEKTFCFQALSAKNAIRDRIVETARLKVQRKQVLLEDHDRTCATCSAYPPKKRDGAPDRKLFGMGCLGRCKARRLILRELQLVQRLLEKAEARPLPFGTEATPITPAFPGTVARDGAS